MIISTIGSCRVAGPMTKLQAQRNFVLDNRELYGFTHNTKETLQAIGYARGRVSIPETVWPFLSEQPYRDPAAGDVVQRDGLHVVEISSMKVLELDGFYLQLVRFKEALSFCPELRKLFFDHPGADQRAERLALLQASPTYARIPSHCQRALADTLLRSQAPDEIATDLQGIRDLLGPDFVLVTHCNALNGQGALIADRAAMVQTVAQAAAALGIKLVDPGQLLAGFGQERSMPDEGRDTAHYTPAFARLVGATICEQLLGSRERSAQPGTEPLDWKQCIERAKLSAKSQEWDSALLYSNRAIELKQGSATAYVLRARAVTALDQTDDIMDAWSIALSVENNRVPAILRQAAEGALRMADYQSARDWAAESLDKKRDEKTALLLGRIYSNLGQDQDAQRAFQIYAAGNTERALRFAARGSTPLAAAANMINALAATAGNDAGSTDSVRGTVLKRAVREVRHAGRAGAMLPTLGAFYALQSLPVDDAQENPEQINQAYRRLLKAWDELPEYQNSSEAVALLGQLASLEAVDPRYVQRAAKLLQARGETRAAGQCWQRLADVTLPDGRDSALLAAGKLAQLGAYREAARVYMRLSQQGALDLASAHEQIDRCLRALARSFRKCLSEGRLRDAEDAISSIQELDPTYQGLKSLQRSLADAHKRAFLQQRSSATNPADVIASAQRVIENSPLDREANIELAMQSLKSGDLAESRRILDKFLQGSPA